MASCVDMPQSRSTVKGAVGHVPGMAATVTLPLEAAPEGRVVGNPLVE
jgi:hypothetical protein